MLTNKQKQRYDAFHESTHTNDFLDRKTGILVGLAAAIALDCAPSTRYYLKEAKYAGVSRGELSEVLAKVMAVAADQKRLEIEAVLNAYQIDLGDYG